MIEKCQFGSMRIDGHMHASDLIIFPDGRVKDNWRRSEGHRLMFEDIDDLVAAGPEMIVAGTGIYGRMKTAADLNDRLAQKGIRLVTAWTKKAVDAYNAALREGKNVGACFHLTC